MVKESKIYPNKKDDYIFTLYKTLYKSNANQGLMNFIRFEDKIVNFIENFKDYYKKLILQSENVEKNDGKSAFIIKRLFKGYLSNPHQLPNKSLDRIWRIYYESFHDTTALSKEFDLIYNNRIKESFIDVFKEKKVI